MIARRPIHIGKRTDDLVPRTGYSWHYPDPVLLTRGGKKPYKTGALWIVGTLPVLPHVGP
jgi:hypothetical protein